MEIPYQDLSSAIAERVLIALEVIPEHAYNTRLKRYVPVGVIVRHIEVTYDTTKDDVKTEHSLYISSRNPLCKRIDDLITKLHESAYEHINNIKINLRED